MIYFIGDTTLNSFECKPFNEFVAWEAQQPEWQLDTESNVVDNLPERKLKTIQFGRKDTQWVLQWDYLKDEEKLVLKKILENKEKKKYIHYALFEYTLLAKYGIIIDNVVDTLLQEKILYTGIETEKGWYTLKEMV